MKQKLFQIGGIQTREEDIFKFLTENKKFQVIISRPNHSSKKEYISKVIEYDYVNGGEKTLNPAGFDFLSDNGQFLIFKNGEESFKKVWSEIFTF